MLLALLSSIHTPYIHVLLQDWADCNPCSRNVCSFRSLLQYAGVCATFLAEAVHASRGHHAPKVAAFTLEQWLKGCSCTSCAAASTRQLLASTSTNSTWPMWLHHALLLTRSSARLAIWLLLFLLLVFAEAVLLWLQLVLGLQLWLLLLLALSQQLWCCCCTMSLAAAGHKQRA